MVKYGRQVDHSRNGPVGRMVASRDPLQVLVAALLFITFSRIHQHYAIIGSVQPGLILFVAAVAYAVTNPRSVNVDNLWTSWPPKAVAVLGALACLSVPFALSIGAAGEYFLRTYSKVLLVFFLTVVAIRNPRDLYLFVWAYVLACAFLVYLSLFGFGLEQGGTVSRLDDLYMYDANGLGVILSAGLPLAVVTFFNSGKWGKWVSLVVILGIGASLARSGSRGGFLGLVVVGGALLFITNRVSVAKRLGTIGLVVLGLVFWAPSGYWDQMQTLTEPTDDYNWTSPYGRKAIAERGLDYMLRHPVTGVGLANFGRAEWKLSGLAEHRKQEGKGFMLTAAHNTYVQVGAELGLPGLFAFCALIVGGIGGLIRLKKRLPPGVRQRAPPEEGFVVDLVRLLPASWLGFAVTAMFLSWAYLDLVYFLAALTAAVYMCSRGVRRDGGHPTRRRSRWTGVSGTSPPTARRRQA